MRTRALVISSFFAVLMVLGLVEFSGVGTSPAQNAGAVGDTAVSRGNDNTANRGSGRTPISPTASAIADAAAAGTLTSPADEADPTTTTTAAPTTTTAAPTTTTTVAPTTTTAAPAPKPAPAPAPTGANSQTGGASYYAQPWSAKGCAHKTIPKGTVLTVTNIATGKSTTCVVNDRGPYIAGRIVDLDTTIFRQLASTSSGVFQARITW